MVTSGGWGILRAGPKPSHDVPDTRFSAGDTPKIGTSGPACGPPPPRLGRSPLPCPIRREDPRSPSEDRRHPRLDRRLVFRLRSRDAASHHPEVGADRLIVIDSYLDLVARRKLLPNTHERRARSTARQVDQRPRAPAERQRQRPSAPRSRWNRHHRRLERLSRREALFPGRRAIDRRILTPSRSSLGRSAAR